MINTPRHTAALVALILSGLCACFASTAAAFSFTPGHIYTTNYFSLDIMETDSSGSFVDSITLSSRLGSETRGIAFGPDHLLYVTMVSGSGFAVYALDSTGAVQQKYRYPVYVAGNLSFGKIAIDDRFIYVSGQDELIRFRLGRSRSGRSIYSNNQVFDEKVLPGGISSWLPPMPSTRLRIQEPSSATLPFPAVRPLSTSAASSTILRLTSSSSRNLATPTFSSN